MKHYIINSVNRLLAVLIVLAAGLLLNQAALAKPPAGAPAQSSPLHPTFVLLDANGGNVLESNTPISVQKTCGQCHDTEYIASHSFHTDLGSSEQTAAGQTPSGRPWDISPGLYGKWSPLSYRYLSPAGDTNPDLTPSEWVIYNAARISGGGPAEEASGMEMNCFVCHLSSPNNQARIQAVQSGMAEWSSTATLLGSGVVKVAAGGYAWEPNAFNEQGELDQPFITIQDPSNQNCAQCHGLVHTDKESPLSLTGCSLDNWQTATTGQIFSGQRISLSGMNLAEKNTLTRSWDIHSERGLSCTDCHFAVNNPAYYLEQAADNPAHLQFDPRRLELSEYLEKPDHNLARGQSAQYTLAAGTKDTMRRCESCHDTQGHADWLPYVERHMEQIACETCHIPKVYGPAVESYDWTVLRADGQPVSVCRGVENQGTSLSDLVTGFEPVLLERSNLDGQTILAPYNLISTWYWVYDSPDGTRPVQWEDLKAAFLAGDHYLPDVVAALDGNSDGALNETELRLDTAAKQQFVVKRLQVLGLSNPRIEAEIQPYSINHNVAGGDWATRECQSCHGNESRLAAPITLAGYLPGGVVPAFVSDTNTAASDGLQIADGALVYTPQLESHGLYVFGHTRVNWIDWFGAFFFVTVLLGISAHGGLRLSTSLRRSKHGRGELKKVYMYEIYERFWHWLQTIAILLLLFTGLVIHRPDIFGWLSFRHMVTVHNVLAAILVINAALSLFYHLVSGEIQQFIPRPYGFFDQAIVQAKYYLRGIFKGGAHPYEKTPSRKMNPLQQATYFGILNVLLPLQIITGALMWGVQKLPQIASMLGGLPFLAPFHSLVAWTFGAFIVGHVYLTTTVGHEPLAGIKAMVNGWEEVEAPVDESNPDLPLAAAEAANAD